MLFYFVLFLFHLFLCGVENTELVLTHIFDSTQIRLCLFSLLDDPSLHLRRTAAAACAMRGLGDHDSRAISWAGGVWEGARVTHRAEGGCEVRWTGRKSTSQGVVRKGMENRIRGRESEIGVYEELVEGLEIWWKRRKIRWV